MSFVNQEKEKEEEEKRRISFTSLELYHMEKITCCEGSSFISKA